MYKEQYTIIGIDEKNRWISIRSKSGLDLYESDTFYELLNIVANDINGEIVDMGDFRYKIKGDILNLTYQWDGVFGINIIYPLQVSSKNAIKFLEKYMATKFDRVYEKK